MGSLRKKTIFTFEDFKTSAEPFTNASFHKANMIKDVNEDAPGILTDAQFQKLVLKLIDHERDEFKREGPEAGITTEELEKMHDYVSHYGWYELHTGKGEASLPGKLKTEYEKLKTGQAMEENEKAELNKEAEKMLTALLKSGNKNCAALAKRVLDGKSTVEQELQYAGGFMTAVLKGNREKALVLADGSNKKALEA
jgi:hypothetical protein